MAGQEKDYVKLARAVRELVLDATGKELREELTGTHESFDALAARAQSIITRVLETPSSTSLVSDLHRGLGALIQMLRRRDKLSAQELATKAAVDLAELHAIESDPAIEPRPRTIHQ